MQKTSKLIFPQKSRLVFVTGGVSSSLGKGLTASALGALLEARGYRVGLMKCDPYINIDPGTMSPYQHGEVFVTEDGAETDLDLGHYERFTRLKATRKHSITTGQIYEQVIANERQGQYLGGTVQVIPHITDEIKRRIFELARKFEILIVEIGGTAGDIEGLPFIEALRQINVMRPGGAAFLHLTYVPYVHAAKEFKSKPTQHSVKELRESGVQPHVVICRSHRSVEKSIKEKIALFCSVPEAYVVGAPDRDCIYELPEALFKEGLDAKVLKILNLKRTPVKNQKWFELAKAVRHPKRELHVAIVGKYVGVEDSYASVREALVVAALAQKARARIHYVDAEDLEKKGGAAALLKPMHAVVVPGGFDTRGLKGKMEAIKYARIKGLPFLGICFGMQIAAIEFARNVCGIKNASTREVASKAKTKKPAWVVDIMESQGSVRGKGASMRLGAYECHVVPGSKLGGIYKKTKILERHRHRYELSPRYYARLKKHGLVLSGWNKAHSLVEAIELPQHPWFVGVQFHPEFQSRAHRPHPLFKSLVQKALAARPREDQSEDQRVDQ